jgi:probable F420-dependent oxidoreductase
VDTQIGLVLPNRVVFTAQEYVQIARAVEQAGFHSIWTSDHIAVPVDIQSRYPFSKDGQSHLVPTAAWCESLTLLGFMAAATTSLRLGTCVIPIVTRDPLSLAKQAATVDVLSGGRLELGVGAGWLLEEAAALGRPSDKRAGRLRETVEIMRAAWTEEAFAHDGEHYKFSAVGVHPHPTQGGQLPVWIGGHSRTALETAATLGDGLLAWLPDLEQLRAFHLELKSRDSSKRLAATLKLPSDSDQGADLIARSGEAGADLVLVLMYGNADDLLRGVEGLSSALVRG